MSGRRFLFAVVIGASDRLEQLVHFGFRYIGSDEGIFWQAVNDYAHGRFHEPFYYGQDYTVMTEAFAAVPLFWAGIPMNIALPLVTALLSLLPFWSMGWWLHRRGRGVAAVLVALLPVLLPVEYGILVSQPRGFVGGCAVLAFWPWCLSIQRPFVRGAAAGAVLALAMFLNPNALLFAAPAGLLFAWDNRRTLRVWLGGMMGVLPVAALWYGARSFMQAHPERIKHTIGDWMLVFNKAGISEAFGQLNKHFAWLMPLWWSQGGLVLLLLVLVLVGLLFRRQWMWAISLALVLALIVRSFGYAKVHDGVLHPFFAWSRMFLAVPVVLAWWGAQALPARRTVSTQRIPALLIAVGILIGLFKFTRTPAVVDHLLATQHETPVQARPVTEIRAACAVIAQAAKDNAVDAVVMLKAPDDFTSYVRCYTCELFEPSMPPTIGLDFDRRAWRRELLEHPAHWPVLVVGGTAERAAEWEKNGTAVRSEAEGVMLHLLSPAEESLGERLGSLGS